MKRLTSTERRKQIVEAAVSLFSEKGFDGTTTRELAKEAGVSEALLFRFFPDKEALYKAILSSKMEEQIPAFLDRLPPASHPRDLLYELALRISDRNIKDPTFMRLLLFSALEGHELSDLFFQRRNLPLVEFLKKNFQEGIRAKKLKRHDPELAARAFLSMIYGFLQTRILFRIPKIVRRPVKEILKTYVKIFLEGISVLFLFISIAQAEEGGVLTLKECFQRALVQSETLAIQEQTIRAAEARYLQALGTTLPHLNVGGSEKIQDTSIGGGGGDGEVFNTFVQRSTPEVAVTLTQPIFQGLREFQALKASSAEKRKNTFQTERTRQLLFFDVALAYYTVLQNESELKIYYSIRSALLKRTKELQERIDLGKSRQSELLTVEADLAATDALIENAKGLILTSREMLAFLIGEPIDKKLVDEFKVPARTGEVATYLAALEGRPDLSASTESVRIAKGRVDYEKGGLLPTVDLEANYYPYRVGFLNEIDWDLLFTFNMPIFQGGATKGKIREAQANLKQSQLSQQENLRAAQRDVRQAFEALTASRSREEALRRADAKAEANYNAQAEEYRLGIVNNLNVLESFRDWQERRVQANRGYYQTKLYYLQLKVTSGALEELRQ